MARLHRHRLRCCGLARTVGFASPASSGCVEQRRPLLAPTGRPVYVRTAAPLSLLIDSYAPWALALTAVMLARPLKARRAGSGRLADAAHRLLEETRRTPPGVWSTEDHTGLGSVCLPEPG